MNFGEKKGFMLKINKTSKKEINNTLDNLSVENLKEDFVFEFRDQKQNILKKLKNLHF